MALSSNSYLLSVRCAASTPPVHIMVDVVIPYCCSRPLRSRPCHFAEGLADKVKG